MNEPLITVLAYIALPNLIETKSIITELGDLYIKYTYRDPYTLEVCSIVVNEMEGLKADGLYKEYKDLQDSEACEVSN